LNLSRRLLDLCDFDRPAFAPTPGHCERQPKGFKDFIVVTTARSFWPAKDKPLKIFDLDSRSLNEIFRSMLNDDNPTERRTCEKDRPKE
jgi:hypothetical protein